MNNHKAGFVNIIGKPNVGKSTLMNALTNEKLSIVTPKAQTTRHRIRAIINGDNYQIVFSDTPGILQTSYLLHEKMMESVYSALEDADIIIYVVECGEKTIEENILRKLVNREMPLYLVINKIDKSDQKMLEETITFWSPQLNPDSVFPLSALEKFGTTELFNAIIDKLPLSPPYFDKEDDSLSDRSDRFFAAEMIREKIFLNYKKEIPYSSQVEIESFKEEADMNRIRAVIFVERDSQKGILIGHKGEMLKKVGTEARQDMEKFFGRKVYLELFVKVREDWRNKQNFLRNFGYDNQ